MPDHYVIRLSSADVHTLGVCLGEGRYREVAPLIADIQRQVNEQNSAELRERASANSGNGDARETLNAEPPSAEA